MFFDELFERCVLCNTRFSVVNSNRYTLSKSLRDKGMKGHLCSSCNAQFNEEAEQALRYCLMNMSREISAAIQRQLDYPGRLKSFRRVGHTG